MKIDYMNNYEYYIEREGSGENSFDYISIKQPLNVYDNRTCLEHLIQNAERIVNNIAGILPFQNVPASGECRMTVSDMELVLVFFDRIIGQQKTNETLFHQNFMKIIGNDFTGMLALEFRKMQERWENIKSFVEEIFENREKRLAKEKDFLAVEKEISEVLLREKVLWENFIKRGKSS
jgi:hypothetical protein